MKTLKYLLLVACAIGGLIYAAEPPTELTDIQTGASFDALINIPTHAVAAQALHANIVLLPSRRLR